MDVDRLGGACALLLLQEHDWVHRRVETIDLLSRQAVRRQVSVDFTVPQPVRQLLKLSEHEFVVPIATLEKTPLRNFDLADEVGRALPVLGREQNGQIAAAALQVLAHDVLDALALELPHDLADLLAAIAQADPADADDRLGVLVDRGDAAEPDAAAFAAVLEDDATRFLLTDLAENYVLLAVVDEIERRRVLKFAYDERVEVIAKDRGVFARLGWSAELVEVATPGAARTASYHVDVVVPEEARVEAAFVYDEDDGRLYGFDSEADRAAVHAPGVPLGARTNLLFGLRLERAGFPAVAAAVAVVTAVVLGVGALRDQVDAARAGPSVSVLLAASAVFAGAVARSGEHRLMQTLFAWPRLVLFANACCALAAAVTLAFGLCSRAVNTTWEIAAAIASACALVLVVTLVRARSGTPAVQG